MSYPHFPRVASFSGTARRHFTALLLSAIAVSLIACGSESPSWSESGANTGGGNPPPPPGADTMQPTVAIVNPTAASNYTAPSTPLNLSGTASDNVGVTQVTWVNSLGGSGSASGTTSWSVGSIALQSGTNVITVTARDAANNTNTDTISVSYSAGGGGGGSVRAFPGAQGFGAAATGGRGGQVVKVTNLNASGAGSLQAALDLTGPRIVVFTVSGVIDSDIFIPHGDLTIAGQTAPGGGITIRGRLFSDYSPGIDNIIIRHVRVRPRAFSAAEGAADQYDGMQFSLNRLAIFDHVSVAFGVDEIFDLYAADDVTVQYSTIEQSSTLGAAGHNYGLINGPDGWRISVHHNLFAHNSNRNPAIANGPADVRNNVSYNVQHGFIHHNPATGPFNIIGNYYKQGPSAALYPFYFDDENGGTAPDLRYYLRDNYIDDPGDLVGSVDNPWATPLAHPTFGSLGLPESPYRVDTEHNFSGYAGYVAVTTETSTAAYNTVLDKAGAWPRDIVTNKSVQDARDRTGSWGAVVPTITELMTGLTPGTPPVDSDNDGMSDAWESAHGLNPQNGNDHSTVMPSGYTAIEEYINELADQLVPPGTSFSFMAYGDSRAGADCSGNAVHIGLVNRMVGETADFVFHLGDMITGYNSNSNWVQDGSCTGPTSFGSFKNMIAPLQNKIPAAGLPTFYFPVVGNHDDNWGSGWYPDPFVHGFCDVFNPTPLVPNHTQQSYFSGIGKPRYTDSQFYSLACSKTVSDVYPDYIYYSFNFKNAHFAVLRLNDDYHNLVECSTCTNPANYDDYYNIHQLDWLRADLAAASANPAIEHIFVFLHAPLFTSSDGHGANVSWPTLSKEFSSHGGKVKMVVSGHNHVYERSKAVFASVANPNGIEDNTNGTVYVVTGGGGSDFHGFNALPWYIATRAVENHYMKIDITGSTFSVKAIKADGTVIDSFTR